jgi:hypothetical protein
LYADYRRLNVPTWIMDPAHGDAPEMDQPADIVQVWPTRSLTERRRPVQPNLII